MKKFIYISSERVNVVFVLLTSSNVISPASHYDIDSIKIANYKFNFNSWVSIGGVKAVNLLP